MSRRITLSRPWVVLAVRGFDYLPPGQKLTPFWAMSFPRERRQITVEKGARTVMFPKVEQVEDVVRGQTGPGAGERALMRAVLEDAIQCLAGAIGPVRERSQLAVEARAWVDASDSRWAFSFENVCDTLGFDAGTLRGRLLREAPEVPADPNADLPASRRPRRALPDEHDIVRMIRAGHPLRVVAETFGISISKASILSCGLASRLKAERDEEIRQLRRTGWTHRALAKQFQLSRIRIMRICSRDKRRALEGSRSAA